MSDGTIYALSRRGRRRRDRQNHVAGNADEKRRNAIFTAARIDGDDSRET